MFHARRKRSRKRHAGLLSAAAAGRVARRAQVPLERWAPVVLLNRHRRACVADAGILSNHTSMQPGERNYREMADGEEQALVRALESA
eukprot:1859932-Prymnesium_polylepis.1